MKFLKKTIFILFGLIFVAITAVVVVALVIDVNQYKPLIIEQAKQTTGRDLVIEDDIELSIFPWLGIELGGVELANAKGFSQKPFAKVEKLGVKVEILPLLKQEISVDQIMLHGLNLSLEKNAQGKTNWDDLVEPKEKAPSTSTKTPAKEDDKKPAIAALAIKGLDVKSATLSWQDDTTNTQATLDQLALTTGAISLNQPVNIKFSAHAKTNQPKADVKLNLNTVAKVNLDSLHVLLNNLAINIDASTPELPAQQAHIKINTNLDAKIKDQQFKLTGLNVDVNAKGENLPGKEINAVVKTAADIDLKKQTASINSLSIESLGIAILASINAEQIVDNPNLDGNLEIKEFNPSLLPSQLGIELPTMQDPTALQKAGMQFDFVASTQSAKLNNLKIKLDKSTINGWVNVKDFSQPDVAYELNLDQMNIDRYLPPPVKTETEQNKTESKPVAEADVPINLPVDLLRKLSVQGLFSAQQIKVAKQDVKQISIKVNGSKGVVRVNPVKAGVLNGQVSSASVIDVRGSLPKYTLDLKASALQAGPIANPILKNLMGDDAITVDGAANVSAHVRATGASLNALKKALNGKANFNIGEANLEGVDASYFGKKVVVDYLKSKNQKAPADWPGEYKPKETTAFNIVRASADIKNGIVTNKDLLLDSKRLKVTGSGTADLPQSILNYRTIVDVQPTRLKTAGEKLLDIPIPVNAKGPFSQLEIKPDMSAWVKLAGKALKAEAKKQVEKKIEEKKKVATDKVKKKVEDKLKNKLKGLFK